MEDVKYNWETDSPPPNTNYEWTEWERPYWGWVL